MKAVQRWVLAGAVVAGLVFAMASGSENTATKVDGGGEGGEAVAADGGETAAAETFVVGDQVALGDYTVTVNSVADPYVSTNQFDQPDAGKRYVTLDVSVTNTDSSPQSVSSIMCFNLVDATGQQYNQTIILDTPATPDGEVDPGGTLRGTLAYEVPAEATGLALKFKCDLLSSGSATINLGP